MKKFFVILVILVSAITYTVLHGERQERFTYEQIEPRNEGVIMGTARTIERVSEISREVGEKSKTCKAEIVKKNETSLKPLEGTALSDAVRECMHLK